MKRFATVFLLCYLCSGLLSEVGICQAQTEQAVATVIALRGTVTVLQTDGKSRKLAIKDTIFETDTISTGKGGRVQVLFRDSTIISLGRNSAIKIAEYAWKPKEETGTMKTKIEEGTFRIMGGAITKFAPQNFSTETPSATIGIRGSMYAGTVTPTSLSVLFQGGKGIDITNPAGTVAITKPGFGTHVLHPGQPPLPPIKFTGADLAAINNELTGNIDSPQDQGDEGQPPAEGDQPATGDNDDKGQPPPEGAQPPPDSDSATHGDDRQSQDGAQHTPQSDNNQGPPNGDKRPPPDGQPVRMADRQISSVPPGTPPPEGSFPVPEGMAPPPMNDSPNGMRPMPDGGYIFLPEGDLAFMPEGDMLAISGGQAGRPRGGGSPPPPGTGFYPDGTMPPSNRSPSPDGTMPPPDGSMPPPPNGEPMFYSDGTMMPYQDNGMIFYPDGSAMPPPSGGGAFMNDPMFFDPMTNFAPGFVPPTASDYYDPGIYFDPSLLLNGDPIIIPTSMPANGLSQFTGTFTGTSVSGTLSGKLFMEVNWHSGKAFGIMEDSSTGYGPPAFFYGTVSGTSLTNVRIIGSSDGHSTLKGTADGVFRGANYELFNVASATGWDYNISTYPSAQNGSWSVGATTQRLIADPLDSSVPTGTLNWSGFAVGISENVNQISSERKMMWNSSDSGFTIAIDRDSGTLDGTMLVNEIDGTSSSYNLKIGGSNSSAFILEDAVIAELGCTGSCINDGSGNGDLNPAGNYLISEDPNKQTSTYMTWGYWEVSHHEPDSTNDPDTVEDMYHTHVPYSLWIAGEKTPSTYVTALIGSSATATYNGFAYGSKTYTSGGNDYVTKVDGTVNLVFTFTASPTLSGSISLPGQTLNLITTPGTSVTSTGFSTSGTAGFSESTSGSLQGNFYGPQINSVGGNFNATVGSSKYLGIFGANKQ